MEDAGSVAQTIVRLISFSQEKTLQGSELSILLKQHHPQFSPLDYRCYNLREFIRKHAPLVYEAGRSGGDPVYAVSPRPAQLPDEAAGGPAKEAAGPGALAGELPGRPILTPPGLAKPEERGPEELGQAVERETAGAATVYAPSAAEPREGLMLDRGVWKTYVSPNGPYRLFANQETGEFQVLGPHDPVPSRPWLPVPPCRAETHAQIAREFTGTVHDEEVKAELSQALTEDVWWVKFFRVAGVRGLQRQWSEFRRNRLAAEFRRTVGMIGIPLTPASVQASARPAPYAWPGGYERPVYAPRMPGDAYIKRVALEVIRRMPAAELRQVWLPLGYVVDETQRL